MRNGLPSLYALQLFEAAARRLNFTRAAEELGLTQGAVSHQIKALEADLGVALFERRGRSVRLTRQGADLLPVLQAGFGGIREQTEVLRREARQGLDEVAIATTTYFAARWLSRRLARFMARHPGIGIRIAHAPMARAPASPVHLEIRWGKGGWSDGPAEKLFEAELSPVCSPSLIPRAAGAFTARDLKGHAFLHDDETKEAWRRWLDHAGVDDPALSPGPVIADPNVRMQAAVDGQGFALTDRLIQNELEAGQLVAPIGIALPGYGYYLIFRSATPESPSVCAFADWLRGEAETPFGDHPAIAFP